MKIHISILTIKHDQNWFDRIPDKTLKVATLGNELLLEVTSAHSL